ncbi:Mediator of RNA polymerase II transcription subunit 6 [Microbotryomycetes sp. JL201]|nr:Mediator of RNA polymerase II transcription subunit 6 [Microbotryomycetes sp. JL201]
MASAIGQLDPSTDLSHVQWRAAEWLLAFGPLTPASVMDYFVMSPFFDRTSNNATLRMQMQFSRGGMDGVDEEHELRHVSMRPTPTKFVGIEYAVVHAAPPSLFIIHKRDRTSPTEVTPIAAYYVLNDSVYQGPSLNKLSSLHALSRALELLREHKPKWTPENQNAWQVKPPSAFAVPASDLDLDEAMSDPTTDIRKRLRESDADEHEREARDAVVGDDSDTQRPANTFNPMLFRALQSVAAQMPALPTETLAPPPPPLLGDRDAKENTPASTDQKVAPTTGARQPPTSSAGLSGDVNGLDSGSKAK